MPMALSLGLFCGPSGAESAVHQEPEPLKMDMHSIVMRIGGTRVSQKQRGLAYLEHCGVSFVGSGSSR